MTSVRNHGISPPLEEIVVYAQGCSTYDLPLAVAKEIGAVSHPQDLAHHMGLYLTAARGAKIVDSVQFAAEIHPNGVKKKLNLDSVTAACITTVVFIVPVQDHLRPMPSSSSTTPQHCLRALLTSWGGSSPMFSSVSNQKRLVDHVNHLGPDAEDSSSQEQFGTDVAAVVAAARLPCRGGGTTMWCSSTRLPSR
ncbi:hypothetical protein SELMODRAFT_413633 [Selaginella moellendorffii]|uniref:Uncharacterized protein n=1 Tax=Selaginella moellendorffii TaxID=88036 RepID=D8RPQ6_SELML|nr:hypothetical protein SELMODRAFT_413633 [Selaginella moellendorffii]